MMIKIIKAEKTSENKPTVAIFFHDFNNSGGTLAMLDLIRTWTRDNTFNIICVFPKQKGEAIEVLMKYSVSIVSFPYWQIVRKGNETLLQIIKKYIEILLSKWNSYLAYKLFFERTNIDLIYTNTSVIFVGAYLSKLLKKPHIWHIREFIMSEHMVVPLIGYSSHYRFVSRHATFLILNSYSLRNMYSQYAPESKLYVIYDDVSRKQIQSPLPDWNVCKKTILMAGNVSTGKGQLLAVEALDILKKNGFKPRLLIAGSVDCSCKAYYKTIEDYIDRAGLSDQVEYIGYADNLDEIRSLTGIGIIMSVNEGFGRVTVEDMLSGMVVIGLDSGGTAELIQDSFNGYKVYRRDASNLAKVLQTVLCSNDCDIKRIRENARKEALKYTRGQGAEQIKGMIIKQVGGK